MRAENLLEVKLFLGRINDLCKSDHTTDELHREYDKIYRIVYNELNPHNPIVSNALREAMSTLEANAFSLFYAEGHEVRILNAEERVVAFNIFEDCNDDDIVADWAITWFLDDMERTFGKNE